MLKRILYILLSIALLYFIFMLYLGNSATDIHLYDTYFVISQKFTAKLVFVSMLILIAIFTFRNSRRRINNGKTK